MSNATGVLCQTVGRVLNTHVSGCIVGHFGAVTQETPIRANAASIPNYGELHRAGERISSAFAESTINQVVSKRMVKKQQMRWTPRGAHLLLLVRTRVLNATLADDFHRWSPDFTHQPEEKELYELAA